MNDQQNFNFHNDPGFFGNIRNFLVDNGRLLLTALIIVLLIGAGIYAFNQEPNQNSKQPETSVAEGGDSTNGKTIYEGTASESNSSSSDSEEESPESDDETAGETIYNGSPGSNEISGPYTFRAERGDGVTHLARKAIARYLDNNTDIAEEITPAHKIYMETMLTKKHYQASLDLHEAVTFSEDEVAEIVNDATELSDEEVSAWQPYVSHVSSINT